MAAIDPHVDLDRPGAPEPFELALLQHTQQLDLHIQRQLADFVEEDRGAIGDLETSDLAGQGPCERAVLPSEELAFHEP